MYEDCNESISATVDSVKVDPQTQLVARLTRVETRTVKSGTARRLGATTCHLSDRPDVRAHVLSTINISDTTQGKEGGGWEGREGEGRVV